MKHKKAFSLVELIIVISILILLAITAISINSTIKSKTENARIEADLITLENALKTYKNDQNILPYPKGNLNYFTASGTYAQDKDKAFGVYGKATENLIPKSYLDQNPLDPRTHNYYAYGITSDKEEFELAGVMMKGDSFIAKVEGIYKAEKGPYNLIREYNGADFVENNGTKLPYNPYEKKLIATDQNGKIYQVGDTINATEDLEIYFSDGSVSVLKTGGSLTLEKMDFPKENDLVSKINLALNAGVIWTKATRLLGNGDTENNSEFTISTNDTVAAVRGTIFKVEIDLGTTKVGVVEGKVVIDTNKQDTKSIDIMSGKIRTVKDFKSLNEEDFTEQVPNFIKPNVQINSDNKVIITEQEDKKAEKFCYLEGVKHKEDESFTGYTKMDTNGECKGQELKCKDGEVVVAAANEEERNFEYKYNSCCLYENEDGICERGNRDLRDEGWELVAYAPYDKPEWERQNGKEILNNNSFQMYSMGNKVSFSGNLDLLSHKCNDATGEYNESGPSDWPKKCEKLMIKNIAGISKIKPEKRGNFYKVGDTIGVFLDREVTFGNETIGGNNYLKYTDLDNLDLGKNFVIEMRVRGLDRTTSLKYYLFDGGENLKAYLNNNNDIQVHSKNGNYGNFKNGKEKELNSTGSLNNITDNNFYIITTKVENQKLTVLVNGKKVNMSNNEFIETPNIKDLVIGAFKSGNDYEYQWNDIIDYVKIYKKQ